MVKLAFPEFLLADQSCYGQVTSSLVLRYCLVWPFWHGFQDSWFLWKHPSFIHPYYSWPALHKMPLCSFFIYITIRSSARLVDHMLLILLQIIVLKFFCSYLWILDTWESEIDMSLLVSLHSLNDKNVRVVSHINKEACMSSLTKEASFHPFTSKKQDVIEKTSAAVNCLHKSVSSESKVNCWKCKSVS